MVSLPVKRLSPFLYLLFSIHVAQSESVLSSISTESCSNECESGAPCLRSSCDFFPYNCLNSSQQNMERRCWEILARTNLAIQGERITADNAGTLGPANVSSYTVQCCGPACEQLIKTRAYAATLAGNPCAPCKYPVDGLLNFLQYVISANQCDPCYQYNCSY